MLGGRLAQAGKPPRVRAFSRCTHLAPVVDDARRVKTATMIGTDAGLRCDFEDCFNHTITKMPVRMN